MMRRTALALMLALLAPATGAAQQQARSSELITLHDDLRLSPEQEAAWRTYTLAIAPSPEMQARHRSAAELLPTVPTPRRIALIEANMAQDEADFRRQAAAVTAFYNDLTPEQQRIFDRESLPSPQDASGAQPPQSAPPAPSRP